MKTTANNNQNGTNKVQNISDFGAKIGGAFKDRFATFRASIEKMTEATAEKLAAAGLSKCVTLPNLEKMTEAGAISAEQARAALVLWRSIDRKPQSYGVNPWAEQTRAKLEHIAEILTAGTIDADTMNAAEFQVLTAANWPAQPFSFGKYTVKRGGGWFGGSSFRIIGGGYYRGESSEDAASIADQLRAMVARDNERSASKRALGPELAVYYTTDHTRYFIAVKNKCEIVLRYCDTLSEAREAVQNERAALLKKYEDLRTFPALRRSWNRPRTGQQWHTADVTPAQFAAALPFKGVEFGNWLNQQERAALLNSAFDGFHDLAFLLGITPATVALGGTLNFSFATRGYKDSAAHFAPTYNTINLNKRNGAGCMAHEWFHACDHYAASLAGVGLFATEVHKETDNAAITAAREIVHAIKKTAFYDRSANYQKVSGKQQNGADYYTASVELAARGFEGVALYLLKSAGMCSDFLVNLQGWEQFAQEDTENRRDCYPYPSDAEAAALLPYYVQFFRALFGVCEVSKEAAEGVSSATLKAQQEKTDADNRAAERARKAAEETEKRRAALKAENERRANEARAEKARKEAETAAKAETTRAAIVSTLSARHFDNIQTAADAGRVYFVAHLEGEIYTGSAEITTDSQTATERAQSAPLACVSYKYINNAKRLILHRYQVPQLRANSRTAAEVVAKLTPAEVRNICTRFVDFEHADNIARAARVWADTQRAREELSKPHKQTTDAQNTQNDNRANTLQQAQEITDPRAADLELVEIVGGVAVTGSSRATYKARKAIKAKGCQWNKTAQRWEATTAEAAKAVRAWFGTEEETTPEAVTAPAEGATTAQEAGGEAIALPEWLKVGAKVRTLGGYMMSTKGNRPEWIDGEELTVKAVGSDFVSLERLEDGVITVSQCMSTATAAANLIPIYSTSEKSQPTEAEQPTEAKQPAEAEQPAERIAASYEGGAPLSESNREGLPDWLHVGTRFCLLDWTTGEPTALRYTCTAIDYENKTITIPEASDSFRGGSHVYRWDAFHWDTFAPIADDTDPTPAPLGEGEGAPVCCSYESGAPCYSTSEKSEPTRNQEIAKIILQQLGGRQFAMMTGAKQFVAIDNGVRFRIGKNKTRANMVKITLRWDDSYNMEFWHIGQEVNPYTILMRYANKGLSVEEFNKQVKTATERAQKAAEPVKLKAYKGIYCDQLQELFTEYTKLYTRLF